jgi:predicted O-linked N-acetylglucosamine transferase (SPINDLY family)
LLSVPNSKLVVKSSALSEQLVRERLLTRFEKAGIAPQRLDLREGSSHDAMLSEYGDIDIALDTFPFNGGMTTLEALWMGVPVVTIAGDAVVSRQTFSALANLGLAQELSFADCDSYIAGAVALASDGARLEALRQRLRSLVESSPLRDAKQFTHDLEALYRRMWRAWCQGEKLPSDIDIEATSQ